MWPAKPWSAPHVQSRTLRPVTLAICAHRTHAFLVHMGHARFPRNRAGPLRLAIQTSQARWPRPAASSLARRRYMSVLNVMTSFWRLFGLRVSCDAHGPRVLPAAAMPISLATEARVEHQLHGSLFVHYIHFLPVMRSLQRRRRWSRCCAVRSCLQQRLGAMDRVRRYATYVPTLEQAHGAHESWLDRFARRGMTLHEYLGAFEPAAP